MRRSASGRGRAGASAFAFALARALTFTLALALASAPVAAAAATAAATGDDAREAVTAARREGAYTFCTAPHKPLLGPQLGLCPLARDVDGCEAFARACDEARGDEPRPNRGWLEALAKVLGPLATALAWLFVVVIVVAIAIPVIRALARGRRDRGRGDTKRPNVATPLAAPPPPTPEEISDAEAALRLAEEHARRGEIDRALSLYLAASLSALDHRGAIRVAKHRTNGEYVRACSEPAARQPLREIVREVDRAVYGKVPPTREAVSHVASRAALLVRAAALATLLALATMTTACGGLSGGPTADPAGDALPIDVLGRTGYTVKRLDTSLATLPMPGEPASVPMIVVPGGMTLEDETEAHLLRWVESGGVLVLMGHARSWPKELEAKVDEATTRDLVVELAVEEKGFERTVRVTGARVAKPAAFKWHGAETVGKLGERVYAARKSIGAGTILAIASDDLFTNVGVARPENAAALVTMLRGASNERTVAIARQEDAIAPPSNPFASLVRAGLGKASFHALGASLLLFLAYGVRQSRPRPAPAPARRAFAEHVEATGAFYGRARAHGHALSAYGRFVEMRLRERVPRGADPASFLASRAAVPLEEASRLYERATQAKADDPPRGDELATIRALRAMVAKALET